MKREYEVVSQETFKYLHVFLVNLASRTPHIHKEIELGLVLKGKLTVREGKNAWSLEQDGMYLILARCSFPLFNSHSLIVRGSSLEK